MFIKHALLAFIVATFISAIQGAIVEHPAMQILSNIFLQLQGILLYWIVLNFLEDE